MHPPSQERKRMTKLKIMAIEEGEITVKGDEDEFKTKLLTEERR